MVILEFVYIPYPLYSPSYPYMAPSWWASGKAGSLAPWSQAKMWALHTMSKQQGWGLEHKDIAKHVKKVGGGCPGEPLVCRFRKLLDRDPEWYSPYLRQHVS